MNAAQTCIMSVYSVKTVHTSVKIAWRIKCC